MKARCPSCDTELEQFETICPVCMRERSRSEIFGAKNDDSLSPREEEKGVFSSGFWIVIGLIAVGYAVHFHSERKAAQVSADAERKVIVAKAELRREVAARERRSRAAPRMADEAEGPDAVDASEAAAAARLEMKLEQETRKAAQLAQDQAADAAGIPRRKRHWTVRGTVYDLMGLTPVSGARLVFKDHNNGKTYKTRTNRKGGYALKLPKIESGGYELTVIHKDYDGIYLEDMQPSFKNQSEDARLETLRSFRRTSILHVPLLPSESQSDVVHDLAILPS